MIYKMPMLPRAMYVMAKRVATIGAYSIILKGVENGEQTIGGAGSVVTKNIVNDDVRAENPAKKIR